MVERVDDECDVLAHIYIDIIWLGEKLRCLVDNIRCENLIYKTCLISFIELLKTIGEKTEGACEEYSLCLALIPLQHQACFRLRKSYRR